MHRGLGTLHCSKFSRTRSGGTRSLPNQQNSSVSASTRKAPLWMAMHPWGTHLTRRLAKAWRTSVSQPTQRNAAKHLLYRLLRRTHMHPATVNQLASTTWPTESSPTLAPVVPFANSFKMGIARKVAWVDRVVTGHMSVIVVLTTDMGPTSITHATSPSSVQLHQSLQHSHRRAEAKAARVAKEAKEVRAANRDIDGPILQRTMVARTP